MSSSFSKFDFGIVEQWQIEEAKDIGLDLTDYKHQITSEFIAHVIKHHGNQISEEIVCLLESLYPQCYTSNKMSKAEKIKFT